MIPVTKPGAPTVQVGATYTFEGRYWRHCSRCGIAHRGAGGRIAALCPDCRDVLDYEARMARGAA